MISVGDRVRHRCWDRPDRIGKVVKLYTLDFSKVQKFSGLPSKLYAEIEWTREGTWSAEVSFLETVDS